MRVNRHLRLLVILALVALVGVRAYRGLSGRAGDPVEERTVRAVRVAGTERADLRETLAARGTVEAAMRVEVNARAFGLLEEVLVEEADFVERGRLLARIEESDYRLRLEEVEAALRAAVIERESAERDHGRLRRLHEERDYRPRLAEVESALRAARAEEENARVTVARLEALFAAEVLTAQEMDNARSRLEAAGAAVARLEAQAAQVREAVAEQEEIHSAREVDAARTRFEAAGAAVARLEAQAAQLGRALEHTAVRAPVSGVVGRRWFDPGVEIRSGSGPLFEILVLDRVDISLSAGETVHGRLEPGLPVEVSADAFPGEVFRGRVERVMPEIERSTRSGRFEVRLENPGRRLRPGMFARAEIELGRRTGALVVPREAVFSLGGRSYLFVESDGLARRREVVTGLADPERLEIISGLGEDERVITAGRESLFDGAEVEVFR